MCVLIYLRNAAHLAIQDEIEYLQETVELLKQQQIKDAMRFMSRSQIAIQLRSFTFPLLIKSMGHGLRHKKKNEEIKRKMLDVYNERYELDLEYDELYN